MAASPTSLQLWNQLTAANGAPTGAPGKVGTTSLQPALPRHWNQANIIITNNSDGVDPSALVRLWVYHVAVAQWVPLGVGYGDAGAVDPTTSGVLNGNTAITECETGGDELRHVESVNGLMGFGGVYLEGVTIGGTSSPKYDAWLVRTQENR